jgi:1,4-alpha-glucan branching enzyme
MIRFLTLTTAANGYLNFMGNELGHPEWIDFPRAGNNWSYKYARRQWSLCDNKILAYHYLNLFDIDMISFVKKNKLFEEEYPYKIYENIPDQILVYKRKNLIFVFNFNPEKSFMDYGFEATQGKYKIVFNSDNLKYFGFNRIDENIEYQTTQNKTNKKHYLMVYAINRAVVVYKKIRGN